MFKVKLETFLRIIIETKIRVIFITTKITNGMEGEVNASNKSMDAKNTIMSRTDGIYSSTKG